MDELTRERYLLGVPYAERYRQPGPRHRKLPLADLATIEERRRILLGDCMGKLDIGPKSEV